MLLSAIKELYDFTPTEIEQDLFNEAFINDEVNIIKNKYELDQNETKGNYTEEEKKRVEGMTYTFNSSKQNEIKVSYTEEEKKREEGNSKQKTNFDQTDEISKFYGLHTLRHTFATNHLYLGTPERILQEWLGHEDLDITKKHYLSIDRSLSKEKIKELYKDLYYYFN